MGRRTLAATAALAFVPFVLVACGSTASPSTSSATSAPAATSAATPSPTPSAALIGTGSATVAGAATTVLTDSHGLTLYYRTSDTATNISCTGGCAAAWPPVLLPTGTPTGSASVTGKLTVFAGPNGNQVLYNGHALYGWKSDTAPGQATGQGIASFLVATPGLTASG